MAAAATKPDAAEGTPRPRICVVSRDAPFAESIGCRLQGWGLSVAVESDLERVAPSAASRAQVEVMLLDVRRAEAGLLHRLAALKRALPALEVILLNQAGRVAVSIEGMRAGASDELSAPFDLASLRRSISGALRRRSKRLERARRGSFFERLERAMSAATFAQAGEFGTARVLLADRDGADRSAKETSKDTERE